MKAWVVQDLETKLYKNIALEISAFLKANPFPGTGAIADWLKEQIKDRLNGITPGNFQTVVAGTIDQLLKEGDQYYLSLFRNSPFITENTKEKESSTPYSTAVHSIFERLRGNHFNNEELFIYSELSVVIETETGRRLAKDKSLQTFGKWAAINNLLEIEHDMRSAWRDNLVIDRIRSERNNFPTRRKQLTLTDIAILRFSHRDRKEAAKDYTKRLKVISKKNPFAYIEEAVKNYDMVSLTMDVSLEKNLSKRLGLSEFVAFVDRLHYPIAQSYALFFIDDLDDFVQIVREICSPGKRKTPKEYLLIITLKSYFNFVKQNISDLQFLSTKADTVASPKIAGTAAKLAGRIQKRWTKKLIKASFQNITHAIFGNAPLSQSRYFIPFFDWLNSNSKLHLLHPSTDSHRQLIDQLNNLFQERLDSDSKSYHYLLKKFEGQPLNHEGLKKLVSVLNVHPEDITLRDRLFDLYVTYLHSDSFWWHAGGNIDRIEAINQAYYFSEVICCYTDSFNKWIDLFEDNRIIHEGWMPSVSYTRKHQVESYLLTTGIGVAHYYSQHGRNEEANSFLNDVLTVLFRQLRSNYERPSIDYNTALWFAAATAGSFTAASQELFIQQIYKRVDSIKLFLETLYALFSHSNLRVKMNERKLIEERIGNEFFLIESSKIDVDLRAEYPYYEKIRNEIYKRIGNTPVSI